MRKPQTLTVVAPFYHEQDGAKEFHRVLTSILDTLDLTYDCVYIDDGSRDQTQMVLNEIADQDARVTVLSLARNFGHQAALTAGLDYAFGDVVVMLDSDLQHPPQVIPQMLEEYAQGADIVLAARRDAGNLPLRKRLTAEWFYVLLERFGTIRVVRGAADFRLMSRQALDELRRMREVHRYLRGMVTWIGFQTAVIQYDQPERFAGVPSYTFRKSLRLAKAGLLSFSVIPLDMITWLGVLLTGLSALYLVYIFILAVTGIAIPGWASQVAVTLIIGGVQLISLGVIAQYIGMIFEEVKGRPLYILKQRRESSVLQTQKQETRPHETN